MFTQLLLVLHIIRILDSKRFWQEIKELRVAIKAARADNHWTGQEVLEVIRQAIDVPSAIVQLLEDK